MNAKINTLRGLAIIFVLIIHITAIFTSMSYRPPIYYIYIFIDALSHFAVPLFVFVSGASLATRYNGENINLIKYFSRRVIRIVPSYIFFSFVYFYLFTNDVFSYKNLNALLTGGGAYHLYFIFIIFQLYLLFPLIMKLQNKLGEKKYTLTLGAFILQIGWYASWISEPSLAKINLLLPYLPFFTLGLIYKDISKIFQNHLKKYIIGISVPLALTLSGTISYFWYLGNENFGRFYKRPVLFMSLESIMMSLMSLIIIVLIYTYVERIITNKKVVKALEILSHYSYEIYLTHVFVLYYLVKWFYTIGIRPEKAYYAPLIFILTLLISFFISFVYKKSQDKLTKRLAAISNNLTVIHKNNKGSKI